MSQPSGAATSGPLDLLTVGRISVDLYAHEPNAGFGDPQTFVKSVCRGSVIQEELCAVAQVQRKKFAHGEQVSQCDDGIIRSTKPALIHGKSDRR